VKVASVIRFTTVGLLLLLWSSTLLLLLLLQFVGNDEDVSDAVWLLSLSPWFTLCAWCRTCHDVRRLSHCFVVASCHSMLANRWIIVQRRRRAISVHVSVRVCISSKAWMSGCAGDMTRWHVTRSTVVSPLHPHPACLPASASTSSLFTSSSSSSSSGGGGTTYSVSAAGRRRSRRSIALLSALIHFVE